MTYAAHLRLTLSGLISDTEQFSCNLAIVPHGSIWGTLLGLDLRLIAPLTAEYMTDLDTNHFEDVVTDCVNFWQDPNNRMTGNAKLRRVKLAAIDADGHYAGSPLERAVSAQGQRAVADGAPFQVSNKVTFETDADLGRVKGGFYLPCPSISASDGDYDPASGLFTVAAVEAVRGSVVTFLNNLCNQPGLDTDDWRVVVASQGRHNANGSVRLAPGNHEVKRVNVGRRPDIIRKRANKRTEARVSDALVSF